MFQDLGKTLVSVDTVILQHVADASHLLAALRTASFQQRSYDFFERLCHRCEANLDALRIAGEKAIAFGRSELAEDAELAGVLALLLAESEHGQPAASEQAAHLLRNGSQEIRQAAWWGLRLSKCQHIERHLRALVRGPRWDFASAAALDILAFHRLPLRTELKGPLDGESEEMAWLLAEAGGRIPGAWTGDHLKRFLAHASPRVREAALRASARCALPELPALCREAAARMDPRKLEAIEFLGVVGSPEDLSLLQRTAANSLTATAALAALGRLALPAGVPILLEFLNESVTAECAAAAMERVTGQQAPRGASPDPPPGWTEDELDLWEPKPPIDVAGANDWWKSNAARFDPNKRWQTRLCVSDDPLGSVFDQLPLGTRNDVYLRQRALVPGTPDWELETWSWKQKNPG
jgi:hypothetical protein